MTDTWCYRLELLQILRSNLVEALIVDYQTSSNKLTLSTDGVGALSIDSKGAVTIATPGSSEVGLTINGGGADIAGDVSVSEKCIV